jgi:hypothetical protein
MNNQRILCLDPSGTGTTGVYYQGVNSVNFTEFKNEDWHEHLKFIIELIKKYQPEIVLYEHTNYVMDVIGKKSQPQRWRGKDMTSLFKIFGAIEGLIHTFPEIKEISYIPVNQVKRLYQAVKDEGKWVECLQYKVGRGKGWLFHYPEQEEQRLSPHMLDAYFVYQIWKEKRKN